MKKIVTLSCLLFVALVWWMPAQAALNLELTQGIDAAIPIAIVPFANETNNVPGKQTLTGVIKNDLQNSGEFRVTTPGLLTRKPTSLKQFDYAYWRKQKVDDVLIGQVKSLGGNQYQVSFQLVGLFNGKNSELLNKSFRVNQTGLRLLAHHISDLIYQKLTGVRGIFSTKVAYILVQHQPGKASRYSLEVADEDGYNPQKLLVSYQPIMSPTWSPNGKSIVYVSFEGGKSAVYLQNLTTGKRTLISRYNGINGAPAFSPDGKKLALVLTLTGNPKIYLLDLATHKLTQMTHGYSIDTEPSWAQDGQSFLFTSNRGGTPQIYRYMLATKKIKRITFDGNYNAHASFLPQEQGIVMMHREVNMFGIARLNLTTGRMQVLTQNGYDESPSLAPNGKMVIYATQYGGRGVLAEVSINGRIKLRLPARDGIVQEPAWSPFTT